MARKKITLSDVAKKHLRIIGYLLVSGVAGWVLAKYVAKDEELSIVLAPAINYVIYAVKKELDREGVLTVLKK